MIYSSRSLSVLTSYQVTSFLSQLGIAAKEYVEYSLCTNNLAGGCNERNVSTILLNNLNFFQYIVNLVRCALLLQLVFQVGKHSTRNLRSQDTGICTQEAGLELSILLANITEVSCNLQQCVQIKTSVQIGSLQHFYYCFCGAVRGSHGHGGNSSIHNLCTSFSSLQQGGYRQTSSCVGMDFDRQVNLCFDGLYQVVGLKGLQQTRHILDTDGVCTEICIGFSQIGVNLFCMIGSSGIRNSHLNMLTSLFSGICSTLQVARIVASIEDTENSDTVAGSSLNELIYNVIGIMAITQQVLTTQQHHDGGIGQCSMKLSQALPGIFIQEANAGVKGCSTPAFQTKISYRIQLATNR